MSVVWQTTQVLLIWAVLFEYTPEVEKSFFTKCSRDRSQLVKDFVTAKWVTILKKYQADIPYDCPLHPRRDLFRYQEDAKKEYGPKQWHCTFCGKTFLTEEYLESHFGLRHQDTLFMDEESICLERYCNHFRCEVLVRKKPFLKGGDDKITDLELWVEKKVLNLSPQKKFNDVVQGAVRQKAELLHNENTKESVAPPKEESEPTPSEEDPKPDKWKRVGCILKSPKNCSRSGQQQRGGEHAKKKVIREPCDKAKLEAFKKECESLLDSCIGGLLQKMSASNYKQLQEELHRSTCWYLTCDHYWEDGLAFRKFPWPLLFILITAMSFGVCLCYYIIWVLFDVDSSSMHQSSFDRQSAGAHEIEFDDGYYLDQHGHHMMKRPNNELMGYGEQPLISRGGEIDGDQYIYITYPVESKIE